MSIGFLPFLLFFFWLMLQFMHPYSRDTPKASGNKFVLLVAILAVAVLLGIFLLLYGMAPSHSVPDTKPAPPLEPPPAVQKADAPLALAKGSNRGT
jgi:hypothetical protein